MKKTATVILVSSLAFSSASYAQEGWLDSLKSMLGMGDAAQEVAAPAMPDMSGMISSLTDNLGVSSEQAQGGLGSLMSYVKNNVSGEQFSALSGSLPGMDSVLSAVPQISNDAGGLGGLLNKAAQYNDTLKGMNELRQQFEALGLSPEMIAGFVSQAKAYLDTPQGQEAKALLTESLSSLI